MSTKTLALAVIGTGCVAAAAGGGYWAVRQNSSGIRPSPVAQMTTPRLAAPVGAVSVTPAAPSPSQEPSQEQAQTIQAGHAPLNLDTPPSPDPRPARDADSMRPPAPISNTPLRPALETARADASTTPAESTMPTLSPPVPDTAVAPPPVDPPTRAVQDPPPAQFQELTVRTDSVIGIRFDTTVSSDTAKIEDRVNAHVTRDVSVNDRVAIPAGAKLEGVVTAVERGGKFHTQGHLGVRFTMLILADGTRVPIQTDTIVRDGDPPGDKSGTKVGGGAVIGAILGAALGGRKGAILGSTAGAASGAAAAANGDRSEAIMPAGGNFTVRLTSPVVVTVERDSVL